MRLQTLIATTLLLLGAGCNHMSYTTLPGDLHADGRLQYREVGAFEIKVDEHYFLWGFAKVSDEKAARAIVEKVREMGGNGVKDLHYKVTWTIGDLCLTFCGSPITYASQTVFVTGKVIQITGPSADRTIPLEQLERVASGQGQLDLPLRYR